MGLDEAFIYSIFDILANRMNIFSTPSGHMNDRSQPQQEEERRGGLRLHLQYPLLLRTVEEEKPWNDTNLGAADQPTNTRQWSSSLPSRAPSSVEEFNLLPKHELLIGKKLISIREIGFVWLCISSAAT